MRQPEILAPAGTFECLKAAVAGGADAVYVGADRFSARAYAGNFSREELLRAIDYVHLFGRKLYLTLNILMKESEIGRELSDWLLPLYRQGLDAVIVQDLGLCRMLRNEFADLPVHASTQMSVTSACGVRLLKKLGIKRVIPARELSLGELRVLTEEGGLEIESFVHGAMCYAYSGRCLFSSFMGDRSGNRGRCAQPCRLSYSCGRKHRGQYLMSMEDMNVLDMIPELADAGIASFKIEGRMKSPEYVYTVSSLYRKYTDLYEKLKEEGNIDKYVVTNSDERLIRSYARDKSGSGYYNSYNGPQMITLSDPSFKSGVRESREADIPEPALEVSAAFLFRKGEPARITLACGDCTVSASSNMFVQEAVKAPLTKDRLIRQLSKTDQYPFRLKWESVDTEEGFLPIGEINDMRRRALSQLNDELCQAYRRKDALRGVQSAQNVFNEYRCEAIDKNAAESKGLHVLVSTEEQFEEALNCRGISRIMAESTLFDEPEELRALSDSAHKAACPKELWVVLPHVFRPDGRADHIPAVFGFDRDELLISDGVVVRTLDEAAFLKEKDYPGKMAADYCLYAFNSLSAQLLEEIGIHEFCFPVELHHKDIEQTDDALNTLNEKSGEEILYYGNAPRMISAQCIRKTTDRCVGKNGSITVTDRHGEKFTVSNRCDSCYNIIYNTVPVSLHAKTAFLKRRPHIRMRLDFTTESAAQMRKVLEHFTGECESGPDYAFTKGHWDKGVL